MCDDASNDILNASFGSNMKHTNEKPERAVVLEYGPYMNWGRWNHNPYRIEPLIDALRDAGILVKISHDEKEGDSREHGWIKIRAASSVIVESLTFQHNRNYQARLQMIPGLVENVTSWFEALEKESKSAHQDREINTTTTSVIAG